MKYPVGEQSFENLRKEGFLYVDKTEYIEKIVQGSKYYFLGRPRRFGKSLFLSTLKCFFEGKRELFKGLYADSMDWDWEE
ncbi:MAG: AAA family ATPase [Muribaculaceae bacterium]|nr:AAA family ATPase [Muribaculaceae bacterium]